MERFEKQLHRAHAAGVFSAEQKAKLRLQLIARIRGEAALARTPGPQRRWFARALPLTAGALVIILLGSTSFATEAALPGSPLYPIKVQVVEEVRAALIFTPVAKAEWDIARAERRLEEAAILDAQNDTSETTELALEGHLAEHVAAAETHIVAVSEGGDVERAADIVSRFEALLTARHKHIARVDVPDVPPELISVRAAVPEVAEDVSDETPTMMVAPEAAEGVPVEEELITDPSAGKTVASQPVQPSGLPNMEKKSSRFAQGVGTAAHSVQELRRTIEARIAERTDGMNGRASRIAGEKISRVVVLVERVGEYIERDSDKLPTEFREAVGQELREAERMLDRAHERFAADAFGEALNLGNEALRIAERVRISAEYQVRFGDGIQGTRPPPASQKNSKEEGGAFADDNTTSTAPVHAVDADDQKLPMPSRDDIRDAWSDSGRERDAAEIRRQFYGR